MGGTIIQDRHLKLAIGDNHNPFHHQQTDYIANSKYHAQEPTISAAISRVPHSSLIIAAAPLLHASRPWPENRHIVQRCQDPMSKFAVYRDLFTPKCIICLSSTASLIGFL
jgi:hypothetical protein